MGATAMGFQRQVRGRILPPERDVEYMDQLAFLRACFDLAGLDGSFAALAGESIAEEDMIVKALDKTIPVMSEIANRLETEAKLLHSWNITNAGKNEVIRQAIKRNWSAIEKLEMVGSNVR